MQLRIPLGVHIIQFNGGLGNQMFEYAFYLALKRSMPFYLYSFDISGSNEQHNGFELDKIFHLTTALQRRIYPISRKLERHKYIKFTKVLEKNPWRYDKDMLSKRIFPTEYIGFFQSEKYFQKVKKIVRSSFKFKKELLNEKSVELAKMLATTENSISVHIRRGDYVSIQNCQTISANYYQDALNHIMNNLGGRLSEKCLIDQNSASKRLG